MILKIMSLRHPTARQTEFSLERRALMQHDTRLFAQQCQQCSWHLYVWCFSLLVAPSHSHLCKCTLTHLQLNICLCSVHQVRDCSKLLQTNPNHHTAGLLQPRVDVLLRPRALFWRQCLTIRSSLRRTRVSKCCCVCFQLEPLACRSCFLACPRTYFCGHGNADSAGRGRSKPGHVIFM